MMRVMRSDVTSFLPLSVVVVSLLALASAGCNRGGPQQAEMGGAGGDGVKAHVDPDTGELRDTPAPGTEPVTGGDVLSPSRASGKPTLPHGAGMKAYVDPATGELRDSPAPGTEPVEGGDVLPPRAMHDDEDPQE